jgi:hypothetical protein
LVFLLLGAGVAHARPQLDVTELEARAGEPVHFSVSGAEGLVEYELEVVDREVLEGEAVGNPILGQFTMPDLGDEARSVKLEAHIEQLGKTTKVKRKIRYAGPAAAASAPGAAPPAAAPEAIAPAPLAPAQPAAVQVPLAPAGAEPAARKIVATQRARRRPRQAAARRTSEQQPASRAVERKRRTASPVEKSKPRRRNLARTAPLFDGVPESPDGPAAGNEASGFHALNALLPPAGASISPPGAGGNGGLSAAVLIPGLLALAALMLAGTTVARRRRLAAG